MTRHRWVMSVALFAATVQGQAPAHSVQGTVFDSVAGAPLAGALVQVSAADSSGRTLSGVTSANGRYKIDGVPSGHYTVSFQHRALVALGIHSPAVKFDAAKDSIIKVDLGIPAGDVVRAAKCGSALTDTSAGMLAGFVIGPHAVPAGTAVEVRWVERTASGTLSTKAQSAHAAVGDDGSYRACGVPSAVWVGASVGVNGYRLIDGETFVPWGGITRLDFQLVDSSVNRGTATIFGRVLTDDGAPLRSGHATIGGLEIDVPIRDGRFTITGIPSGTWNVETLALGYEPHAMLTQVDAEIPDSIFMTITHKAQALDPVAVIAKQSREMKIIDGIMERSRVSGGTMFLPGNIYLANAEYPWDPLRAARGFRLTHDLGGVWTRGCDSVINGHAALGKRSGNQPPQKQIVVYLDGVRWPLGIGGLKQIPAREILAIEAYPDVMAAPPLWRTNDACAVVGVWTKY